MRSSIEFDVGQHTYQAAPMNAKIQMNVARRVTPLLVGLVGPALEQLKTQKRQAADVAKATGGDGEVPITSIMDMDMTKLLPGLGAAASMISKMPDDEFDYVQTACLRLVSRQREGGTGWMPIWNDRAGLPQFDDIEGHELLSIMIAVLTAELGPFFAGLVSSLIDGNQS